MIDGDVTIEQLDLDGALHVSAAPGARLVIKKLKVKNAGGKLRELSTSELAAPPADAASEVACLRGYVYEMSEIQELLVSEGEHVVSGTPEAKDTLVWRMSAPPVPVV